MISIARPWRPKSFDGFLYGFVMLFSDTQFGQIQLRKALNVILLGIHRTDNHAHCTRVVRNRVYQYEGTGRTVLLIGIENMGFAVVICTFPISFKRKPSAGRCSIVFTST